jgi:hypothetical protein
MALIEPVNLQIAPQTPSSDKALVQVGYRIVRTLDDVEAVRTYREVVQLFREGRLVGDPGVEHPVPDGTMLDATVVFTADAQGFTRDLERLLPFATLRQGASTVQSDAISARVTLTPFPETPPTRQSNVVQLDHPPAQDRTSAAHHPTLHGHAQAPEAS